jgi:hypothetical protein
VHLEPHMDEEGLSFFKGALKNSKCYLEFGCGGSTVYASNQENIQHIISIDTDLRWVTKIQEETANCNTNLYLDHLDLGEVGDWGTPINKTQCRDFYKYSVFPWKRAAELKIMPDTVLIDGRFRVSCFLYSLLAARVGTTVIFDDYFDRPYYFVVEKFCKIEYRAGRAGVFKISKQFNVSELVSEYAHHILDWS